MNAVVEQARAGDPALLNLFREAGEVLGDAAGILIQTLEPDHIVICGPGTRAMDLLRPSFEAALEIARPFRNCARSRPSTWWNRPSTS